MAFELDPRNKRGTKRRYPARGSNSFDNPLNNRDESKPRKTRKATMKGDFGGDYIGTHFGPSGKGAKNAKKNAAAAKAVLNGLKRLSSVTGSAGVTMKLRGGKNADDVTFTSGDGKGRRPADEPAAGAVETGAPSGQRASSRSSSGGSSKAAAAVARSQEKAKPGKVYEKTRSYWKDDGEKAKRFDMEMTGDEIRAARKEFLRTHPAARRAVENGTMSMGDVNIMVRRLSKRKKSRQG